jgi:hypothetical protein
MTQFADIRDRKFASRKLPSALPELKPEAWIGYGRPGFSLFVREIVLLWTPQLPATAVSST